MKKISLLLMPLMASSFLVNCGSKAKSWSLTNPNGSLLINVNLSKEGSLTYSVKKNGKQVVNTSTLGMAFTTKIDGKEKKYDFSKGLKFVSTKSHDKQFSYVCHSGKVDKVSAHYKEKIITTKVNDLLMDVTFRALDDGYGFQYSFKKENGDSATLTWNKEFTEFNIPFNSLTYGMDYVPNTIPDVGTYYSYEEHYATRSLENIDPLKQVSMPFGYETNGYYSFITESGLIGSGYHGSFLKKNDKEILATVEAPAHGTSPDYTVALPFTSPWRVSCVGSYATAFETTIVEDILGDIKEYTPEGEKDYNYNWVEPGLTAWNWYKHPDDQANYDLQKKYIDLAKKMGWKYTIFDGGWDNTTKLPEDKVKELISYAHEDNEAGKPIKVILWAHTMEKFKDKPTMIETLDHYSDLGADGLKVDFWDGQPKEGLEHQMEDKQTIQQYDDFYKLTAKYHMVVNCHGCNKPTGERRRYPHVINREAIRGNEMNTVYAGQGVINTILRGAVGPTDFTPVVRPTVEDVTVGYQMALTVLLESGIPSMADLDTTYEDSLYQEYYQRLPAHWDKAKFIIGNPQTHMVVARKKGDNWWVAGVTTQQRTIDVDFSFLEPGSYTATIYNGSGRGPEANIDKTTKLISSGDKEKIDVTDNAGFVIELIKK